MISFVFMTGLSYFLFLLTLVDANKFIGPYVPWLFLAFSFPHFLVTYYVWTARVKSWKREWLPVYFPVLYCILFWVAAKGLLGAGAIETILKLSYLYLLYHFAQQLYGVTLWVNLQNNIVYSVRRKYLLRLMFLSACFYTWTELEMRGVVSVLFYHPVSSWGLHSNYIIAGFVTVFLLTLFCIGWSFYDYFKMKDLKNLASIGTIGLAWLWFIPPLNQNIILFLPILHGLQYLPFIKLKVARLNLSRATLIWSACICGGWVFFRWIPFELNPPAFTGTLWPAFVLSLLNNHHFLIDGRIWKLRDPANQDLLAKN